MNRNRKPQLNVSQESILRRE